ncbi:MAG: hypothetical protein J2P28_09035 [Actinobacteria bacterium]|nr:hypothetical protein [Actinomycetota bacterium]MBO0835649.1 hypothetical protein [Actinomycetota bacterium]
MTFPENPQPGGDDIIQFGWPARRRSRWLGSLLLACLVAAAVLAIVTRHSGPRAAVQPQSPSLPLTPAPVVSNVGHPILGIRAGWQLFGLAGGLLDQSLVSGGSDVVAVQFAHGRIVRTAFPPLASSGPVSFVVARNKVIVRPLDYVPGYVIRDGKPARPLTGILAQGGTLLPGPGLSQQWFHQGFSFRTAPSAGEGNWLQFDPASVLLIGPDAKPTGLALPTPSGTHSPVFAMADGRGDVVLVDSGGAMYDAGPGLLRPIGAQLIAIGPTTWLGVSCAGGACRDVIVSPAAGTTKALHGQPITATARTSLPGVVTPGIVARGVVAPGVVASGLVAPDGATAAVVLPGRQDGTGTLELINLATGTDTHVDVPVGAPSYQQLAWSPDGQWLFAVTSHGTLAAISMRTGRVEDLRLGVSGLSQIAIRPASG